MTLPRSMISFFRIPDLITLINSILGFTSIFLAYIGEFHLSFSFILLAVLGDGLDGWVAGKTESGEVGAFLDSMSDLICFAVAPVFFVYLFIQDIFMGCLKCHILLVAVLTFFFISGLLRLSSYNLMKQEGYFTGLPISSAAMIIMLFVYLNLGFYVLIAVLLLLSFSMLSPLSFVKPDKKIGGIAVFLVFSAIILGKNFDSVSLWSLLIANILYVFLSPIYLGFKNIKN
ncbi:MAG: CDP-alcohol phosphatidyltransferase family protein [Candidatus Thermoplasmatota archaeon]